MKITPSTKLVATVILGLGLLAVAAVLYIVVPKNSAPPPAPAASGPVSVVAGVTVVSLDAATQQQSGLRIEPLPPVSHRTALTAYGTVIDLQPLIDLRIRRTTAQAELTAATVAADASRAEFERNRVLYQDDRNVSLKAFQGARASYRTDQAKVEATGLDVRNIDSSARQQFGASLAGWAIDSRSPQFARLLARKDVLARITLPVGAALEAPGVIQVQGNGAARLPGYLVSPAAQNDPGLAGNAYIYRVPAPLATGTPLVVFLPTSTEVARGVLVPSDAVVWYAGQPWVYVQAGPTRFARRPLGDAAEMDGGFFVMGRFKAGEGVVTRGAQLLLSEEQRPPATGAGCKDPECD